MNFDTQEKTIWLMVKATDDHRILADDSIDEPCYVPTKRINSNGSYSSGKRIRRGRTNIRIFSQEREAGMDSPLNASSRRQGCRCGAMNISNPQKIQQIHMKTTQWHVRSNGLNFLIMDQNANIVAECKDEAMARYIIGMRMALEDIARIDKDPLSGLGEIARNALRN